MIKIYNKENIKTMTKIQTITIKYANNTNIVKRVMIEELNPNTFRVYVSAKTEDTIYTPFEAQNQCYNSASAALHSIVKLSSDKIVEINNEISDLLTKDEIVSIVGTDNIIEN